MQYYFLISFSLARFVFILQSFLSAIATAFHKKAKALGSKLVSVCILAEGSLFRLLRPCSFTLRASVPQELIISLSRLCSSAPRASSSAGTQFQCRRYETPPSLLRMPSLPESFWPQAIFALLFAFAINANAQQYPVQVTTTVMPPNSLFLDDYVKPGTSKIMAHVLMTDLNRVNYPVKLRLKIQGLSTQTLIQTKASFVPSTGQLTLNGGVPTLLTSDDLQPYFALENLDFVQGITLQEYQRAGKLPEGLYRFQIEVLDFNREILVSNPIMGAANVWLMLNNPPLLNFPANNAIIPGRLPQNIAFNWSPQHMASPNSATNVKYEFKLVEVYPIDTDPNAALLSSRPIYEIETFSSQINYGIAEPALQTGKRYAYQIRAFDPNPDAADMFRNEGKTEVGSFYFGPPCAPPAALRVSETGPGQVFVEWDAQTNADQYVLSYTENGMGHEGWGMGKPTDNQSFNRNTSPASRTAHPSTQFSTYENSITIKDLTWGSSYSFSLQCDCGTIQGDFGENQAFVLSNPCPAPENIVAEVTGPRTASISFDQPTPTPTPRASSQSTVVRYRPIETADWTTVPLKESPHELSGLTIKTSYEYQLASSCDGLDPIFGETQTFETEDTYLIAEEGEMVCGTPPDLLASVDASPYTGIQVGDIIDVGEFQMKITALTGSAPYSGEGTMLLPMADNIKVGTSFTGIEINAAMQMYKGEVDLKGGKFQVLPDKIRDQVIGISNAIDEAFAVAEEAAGAIDEAIAKVEEIKAQMESYLSPETKANLDAATAELASAEKSFQKAKKRKDKHPEEFKAAKEARNTAKDNLKAATKAANGEYKKMLVEGFKIVKEAIKQMKAESEGVEEEYKLAEKAIDDLVAEREKEVFGVSADELGEVDTSRTFLLDDGDESFGEVEIIGPIAVASTAFIKAEKKRNRRKVLLWLALAEQEKLNQISQLIKDEAGNVLEYIATGVSAGTANEDLVEGVKLRIGTFLDEIISRDGE